MAATCMAASESNGSRRRRVVMKIRHRTGWLCLLLIAAGDQVQARGFEVRDSIEMATFSEPSQFDPLSQPLFSPDGRYFCVVTSRGVILTDKVESTLRVFDAGRVRSFLTHAAESRPLSQVAATFAEAPAIRSNGPYESIITKPRWSADSRAIYFLAQNSRAERRLYVARPSGGRPYPLTPIGEDVIQYDVAVGTIAYLYTDSRQSAAEDARRKNAGQVLSADARSVTGLSLGEILFPEQSSGRWFVKDRLAIIRNGKTLERPLQGGAEQPLHLLEGNGASILSMSPDGRFAVELLPVSAIPSDWEAYEPTQARLRLHAHEKTADSPPSESVPRRYTLIDLSSGAATPLMGPQGQSLGYPNRALVMWSHDGKRLLLTNTFLPVEGVADAAEQLRRHYPCTAAVVEAATMGVQCVARAGGDTSSAEHSGTLIDASFENDGDTVVLGYQYYGSFTAATYRHGRDGWTAATSVRGDFADPPWRAAGPGTLSIGIRQTLNAPPALWAADASSARGKDIWNPNPQLSDTEIGEASVYGWTDDTGYEWSAGLIKPVGYAPGRRYPLVIQTHGFMEGAFLTDGAYPTAMAARPLASAGMVVLQMSTRYSHNGSIAEATDHVAGFKSVIAQLAKEGLVDPARVGIIGFSRTCWYVENALIGAPSLFAAATIADGIDGSFMGRVLFGSAASSYDNFYGGMPFGDALGTWIEKAPDFHRAAITAPLRLEAHSRGGILGEWGLYSALSMQSKPVDLVFIPDGQHILQKPLERIASQQGDVDWFRFWLQGYEDPEPAKAGQYAQWERLCDLQMAQGTGNPTSCVGTSGRSAR